MSLVTNVFRRGGSYYFRARVPDRFRAVLERRELWRSLRTGDSSEARQRASVVAQLTQRLWRNIEIMKSKTTGAELVIRAKALVDAWVIAELADDEDLRVQHSDTEHPGLIRRHRLGDNPDVYDKPLSADELTAFLAMPKAEQDERLGADGTLLLDVNEDDLRRAQRYQMLDGAVSRLAAGSDDAAAIVVRQLFEEAGMDIEPRGRPFIAAKKLMMRAQVDLRKAIHARYTASWEPDLDPDPAIGLTKPQSSDSRMPPQPPNPAQPAKLSFQSETLSKAVQIQVLESLDTGRFLPGRGNEYRKAANLFIKWFGSDPCVDQVTVRMAGEFRTALLGYPTNAGKFPALAGLSFGEVVRIAAGSQTLKTMSVTTANGNYITPLRSIFQWAVQSGRISSNPFADVKITAGHRAPKLERRSFTFAELQALLASTVFTGSKAPSGEGLYQPGPLQTEDWRFWLPLMALYSGARLNELSGLHLINFSVVEGVPVFHVQDGEADQRIKSKAANRIVPVHQSLIDLGLLNLVATLRSEGETRLFPDLSVGQNGYYSDKPTKFFGRLIDRTCGSDPTLVFHSFRHTFITKLREAGISKEVRTALVGHEGEDTHDGYGEEPVARLNAGVQAAQWPSLRLPRPRQPSPPR